MTHFRQHFQIPVASSTQSVGWLCQNYYLDNLEQFRYLVDQLGIVGVTGPTGSSVTMSGHGISQSGFVGTTSFQLVASGTFTSSLTIQNTHASQTLYVGFATTVSPSNGFMLIPGASLTLPFGPTNALNGVGSGSNTSFIVIGR
jgi:hypothetical protein